MNNVFRTVSATLALSAMVALGGNLLAQNGAPAGGGTAAANLPHKVALIDMAVVFKQYKKFESLRADLKEEIEQSEAKAKGMAENLQSLQAKMKTFREGSPEFGATEKELASLSAEFETFRRAAQRDFLKKESQIYHTVYLEVTDAVKKYAEYYKYTLVMRFSREDLDKDNPQALIQGMNRQVVYYHAEDDITDPVLKFLNQKFGGPATPANAPAGTSNTATRPGNTTNR